MLTLYFVPIYMYVYLRKALCLKRKKKKAFYMIPATCC